MAEPIATEPRGWGIPGRSNKAHYFVATMSLCRKWGFYQGELYDDKDDHSQNCVECKRKVGAFRASLKST